MCILRPCSTLGVVLHGVMCFYVSHVLRVSAPADVMCWQCVWSSPAVGWSAGFLNIQARLGAEPVLSRTGSPDSAQPALAAPYTGAAVAPPDGCCQHCFWQSGGTGGALGRPSPVQGRRDAPGRKCLALRLGFGDTPCHLHLPLDEIPIYSPVLGAAVQHLPDPF